MLALVLMAFYQDPKAPDLIPEVIALYTEKKAEKGIENLVATKTKTELGRSEAFRLLFSEFEMGFRQVDKGKFAFLQSIEDEVSNLNHGKTVLKSQLDDVAKGNLLVIPALYSIGKLPIGWFYPGNFSSLKVLQVTGKDSLLVSYRHKFEDESGVVKIRNFPTDRYVDGNPFVVGTGFKLVGTETYQTAIGGSKKVYLYEPISNDELIRASKISIEKFGPKWKQFAEGELAAEKAKKEAEESTAAKMKILDQQKAKAKFNSQQAQARDSIAKLIRGLASYEQRYEDSFKESKESVMDQMQDQAKTYIQGADKRLNAAIKEMEAAKIPEDERIKLVTDAKAAIAKAKKKVGIK